MPYAQNGVATVMSFLPGRGSSRVQHSRDLTCSTLQQHYDGRTVAMLSACLALWVLLGEITFQRVREPLGQKRGIYQDALFLCRV